MKTIRNLGAFGLLLLILAGQSFADSNRIDLKTKERILARVSHLIQNKGFTNEGYKMLTISKLFRQANDAQAIIIDLRNNYGGYLHNALHLAGKVLERNQIFALHVSRKHYSSFEYEVDLEKHITSS